MAVSRSHKPHDDMSQMGLRLWFYCRWCQATAGTAATYVFFEMYIVNCGITLCRGSCNMLSTTCPEKTQTPGNKTPTLAMLMEVLVRQTQCKNRLLFHVAYTVCTTRRAVWLLILHNEDQGSRKSYKQGDCRALYIGSCRVLQTTACARVCDVVVGSCDLEYGAVAHVVVINKEPVWWTVPVGCT